MKSFSFILLKFVMHVTNKQFPDKFDNGWNFFSKWPIYCDFLLFFSFYVNNLTLWTFKFNNGGGLFSSVLLLSSSNDVQPLEIGNKQLKWNILSEKQRTVVFHTFTSCLTKYTDAVLALIYIDRNSVSIVNLECHCSERAMRGLLHRLYFTVLHLFHIISLSVC